MRKQQLKLWLLTLLMTVGGVSSWAQKDVTSQYITNATLSSLNGWTNVNFNTPVKGNNTKGYASECYAGWGSLEKTNYSLTQTITLPAGKYTLVNYSFFRYGLNANTDASKSLAYLKAGDSQVAIKTLGSITAAGYANSQAEGANAFDSKMYRNTLDFTIDADNTKIEIGLVGTFDLKQSWIIAGMFELIDNGQAATMDSPFDVTGYITNPGFEYRDMTGWTMNPSGFFGKQDNNQSFKVGGYYAEKWQASGALPAGSMSQTISDLPAGYYKLTANLGGNGTYIDLNGKTVSWTADGNYTTGYVLSENEDLTITAGKTAEGTANWIHFDNFKLQFCGDVQAALNTLLGQLSSYESKLPSNVYSTLSTNVSAYDKSYSDVDELLDAITNVQNLYTAADANSEIYLGIKDLISAYAEKAATLDAAGQAAYDVSAIVTENNTNGFASISAAESLIIAALTTATKAQTTVGSDWTAVIANPSFEYDFSNGWTNKGMARQDNTSFGKTGNYYAEKWEPNETFGVSQTIAAMPAGVYRLTARSKARSVTSAKIYAAGVDKAIAIGDTENDYSVEFACDANADITIGFEGVGTGVGASWLCVDNFTMSLVSAGLPDVEAVTGKMNAEVAATQTAAIETYMANKTVANYNAAQAAIAAAEASKAAYAIAATAIADANAVKTNQNFATDAAITAFENAIQTIQNGYDNSTLTDNEATNAGLTLGVGISGVRDNPTGAAIQYLNSGFGLTNFDAALYVNTWSIEGASDNSNFTIPFYEYWVNDENSLAEKTWTGTLTGLPNGLYSVTAWVRVRAKNGVAANDATGITMDVNGDGEGDYAAVDITEGTQIGESQFQLKEYTAKGLVKDGTLKLNFVIGEDNNISWLSFKNVYYTKVRDLTSEEAAIAPTTIALKNGEDVVTEVALNATTNTVTLTPSYTPANASEGYISWTTSDANVATVVDGVVTGVAPGTATITATSTLAPTVSGSVTVTVTYPESTIPATYEVVEGFTKTIYTLGENIIKNGSFEYPDGFYGWTDGQNPAKKLTSTNFDIMTESAPDGDQYLRSKSHTGAGEAGSIGTGWEIEEGATYVFGYKTKAVNAANAEYQKFTLTNTLTEETNQISVNGTAIGTDWTNIQYLFTNSDNYQYAQFRARWLGEKGQLTSFDNFYLCKVTNTEEVDLRAAAADYEALNDAIDAKDGKTLGFDEGEYAPYNNVEVIKALAAAKAINQDVDNLATDVRAATDALDAASWSAANTEEVNAVYDGTFAAAENNGAPAGWRMSNNTLGGDYHSRAFVGDDRLSEFNDTKSGLFLRFDGTNSNRGSMYYYGDTEGYTMPLDADTYYRVTVDFAGWGSTGKPLQMNVTGPEGFTTVSQQYTTSVRADNADNAPQQFNIIFKTAGAGNYVINFQTPGADTNTHNVIISNVVLKKAVAENITIDEDDDYTPALKYANVTFNRTLVEGWNGLVLPFEMTVEGVKNTFSATNVKNFTGIKYVEAEGVTLQFADFAAEAVIPAGTPFLVKAAAGTSYTIDGVLLPATGLKNITWTAEGNDNIQYTMTGTYAANTDLTNVNFALINGNNFYYHTANKNSSSAAAFRAYFVNDSTEPDAARVSFDFGDDETTGIQQLNSNTAADGQLYDLQGRRVVNQNRKGLYIQNGRKVVVK